MKKVFLALAIIYSGITTYGQGIPQLKLTPNGVYPIIVRVDSMSASDIYQKAQNWVQETYKNPNKVLKANIKDEKIRVDGFVRKTFYNKWGMRYDYNMCYSVEISFKDGGYRFEYSIGDFQTLEGEITSFDYKTFFTEPSLELTINELSQSFYNYVVGETVNDDW